MVRLAQAGLTAPAVAGQLSEGLGLTRDVRDKVRDPNVDTCLEEKGTRLAAMMCFMIEEMMEQ